MIIVKYEKLKKATFNKLKNSGIDEKQASCSTCRCCCYSHYPEQCWHNHYGGRFCKCRNYDTASGNWSYYGCQYRNHDYQLACVDESVGKLFPSSIYCAYFCLYQCFYYADFQTGKKTNDW